MSRTGKLHMLIVKVSTSDGCYVARSCMGTIRGLRWGKWVTVERVDAGSGSEVQFEAAKRVAREASLRMGLARGAVFYEGRKVWTTEDEP